MWPPMRAGAPSSSVGPRGCSDSRVRSPEAVGGDRRDVVDGGEGKAAAEGGEWSSREAQTEPGLANGAEFRVPGQRAFFALLGSSLYY